MTIAFISIWLISTLVFLQMMYRGVRRWDKTLLIRRRIIFDHVYIYIYTSLELSSMKYFIRYSQRLRCNGCLSVALTYQKCEECPWVLSYFPSLHSVIQRGSFLSEHCSHTKAEILLHYHAFCYMRFRNAKTTPKRARKELSVLWNLTVTKVLSCCWAV